MKKKFLFALSVSAATIGCAIALMPKSGIMSYAEGCEHVGNHYDAVAATCSSAGSKEFWACCVCHEQFVTTPGKGTWTDMGAYAGPALESTHPAYVAPLVHTPGTWGVYERDTTLGVNASCSECGEACYDSDVTTVTKPTVSTAEWTVTQASASGSLYAWNYDENTKIYTAGNSMVGSSVAVMSLDVTKAGTITFDFSIICEVNYDYLTVYKNSTITSWTYSSAVYGGNGKVWSTYGGGAKTGYSGTYSLDVEAGDVITFAKRADSSGWGTKDSANYDECTVKFATSYTYGLVNYDVQGGSSVYPGITIDGCVASEMPTPTKDGYTFDGWYKSTSYADDEKVEVGTYIGDGATVYAKWWDNAQTHALAGSWKGFAFRTYSTGTSVSSLLSNYSITINYKGELTWVSSNSTDAYSGTFSDLDADGNGTIGERLVSYDADDGVIIIRKSTTNTSNYYWVFVKDSSKSYTSSTVTGCCWGNYSYGYQELAQFPLADGSTKILYVNSKDGVVHYGVQAVSLMGDSVSLSAMATSTNVGLAVYEANGTLIQKFGYNGSTMIAVTDDYWGVYTNSVAGDEITKIVVSGAGKFSYYNGTKYTNGNDYKVSATNVLYYASGAEATQYTLDTENGTFARSVPTITVTYDLNGHEGTMVASTSSYAKYTLDGMTQKFCKALDSSTGAWLYTDALAKIENSVSTDGLYAFEGWYKDAACTTAISQCHPTEDMTLYAKWTRSYTVTCVLNNGSDNTTVAVKEGQTPSLTDPTRDGYMFGGWYTDEGCTNPYVAGAIAGDITVYAKWIEKPQWAKGRYGANNVYGTRQNYSLSEAVGYATTFNDNGNIVKGTSSSTYGTYTADSTLDENGYLHAGSDSKLMAFSAANDGRYFFTGYYGTASSDPVPGDMIFAVQLFGDETATFLQTTLVANKAYLVKTTVTDGDTTTEYVTYIDSENDKLYADCTLSTSTSGVTDTTFASVYVSNYADSITITSGGKVVGVWGLSGSSLVRGDTYAGTYTGTFNGAETALVFDGFGNVTAGDLTGTYSVTGSTATLTFSGTTYTVTLSGSTYTQVLDGYEGTYTGTSGTLVVTGYGTCTLDGVSGTYVISSGKLKVTVNGTTSFFDVDKDAGTYTIASASIFSGLTFSGTHNDSYGDSEGIHFIFDEGAAITGTCKFGSISSDYYKATFTGEYADGVLTITFTSDIYSNTLTGKTVTFSVADGKLTCTASQLTSGVYMVQVGTEVTNSSFVVPTDSSSSTDLVAATYTGECDSHDYTLVIYSETSGHISNDGNYTDRDIEITKVSDGNYSFADEDFYVSGTITVNSNGTLTVELQDSDTSVYGTFTFSK